MALDAWAREENGGDEQRQPKVGRPDPEDEEGIPDGLGRHHGRELGQRYEKSLRACRGKKTKGDRTALVEGKGEHWRVDLQVAQDSAGRLMECFSMPYSTTIAPVRYWTGDQRAKREGV
jgi:hypothetical protein